MLKKNDYFSITEIDIDHGQLSIYITSKFYFLGIYINNKKCKEYANILMILVPNTQ